MVSIVRKRKHKAAWRKERLGVRKSRNQQSITRLRALFTHCVLSASSRKKNFRFAPKLTEATSGSSKEARKSRAWESSLSSQRPWKCLSVNSSSDSSQKIAFAIGVVPRVDQEFAKQVTPNVSLLCRLGEGAHSNVVDVLMAEPRVKELRCFRRQLLGEQKCEPFARA